MTIKSSVTITVTGSGSDRLRRYGILDSLRSLEMKSWGDRVGSIVEDGRSVKDYRAGGVAAAVVERECSAGCQETIEAGQAV